MKFGMRKVSPKRSFKARTTGKVKRVVKKATVPGYGRRGRGTLHPKRAVYNRIYRRTSFGLGDILKKLLG